MSKILDILQSEYSSEYFFMSKEKKYGKPGIYPKILMSKPPSAFSKKQKEQIMREYNRWYVYYSYRHPETGKMVRQPPIYYNVNRKYFDFDEKLKAIKVIRQSVETILKKGFSPYESEENKNLKRTEYALDFALSVKKNELKPTTYADYVTKINLFKKFLKNEDYKYIAIKYVDKRAVAKYLNSIPGPKNSNNHRAVLSSVFSILSENDFIETNFVQEIRNKKITEKGVKIYTEKDIDKITELLKKQDYTLLMFIRFICYMFWRPVEILRIKVDDIDFENRIIKTNTKTKDNKKKIIPEILIEDLKEFAKGKSGYLFKPDGFTEWDLPENDKRNYFTRRFARFRDKNSISKEFKMYSFRHTYITKLYLEFRKELSKDDTVKKLSLITGHESKAIYKYIQTNDVELPDDYSEYLK